MKEGEDEFPGTGLAWLAERFNLSKSVVALADGDTIGGVEEIVLSCDLLLP